MDIISWSTLLVLPFWMVMIWLPTWPWTLRIMRSDWILLPAAAVFLVLFAPEAVASVRTIVLAPTTEGVHTLLSTDLGRATAWTHLLLMDLFVGRWAYLDSREREYPHLTVSLILAVLLVVAPLGLLLYLGYRRVREAT